MRFTSELQNDPAWIALMNRVAKLESKASVTSTIAFAQQEKRYRLAMASMVSLITLGGTATVSVVFSSPFATTDYKVDVTVATTSGQAVSNIVVSNKTVNGCTVAFTTPVALAIGTTVGVLAISAPTQ